MKSLRLLIILLCVTMAFVASAFTDNGLEYAINGNGTVKVTGLTGGKSAASGSLVIPATVSNDGNSYTVTEIAAGAFKDCTGFTGSLTIPNTVTHIGGGHMDGDYGIFWADEGAFSGCSGFTGDLNIPNSVTEIGMGAFYGCSGFNGRLNIGNSVTHIGAGAFKDCSGFTGDLNIPNSVKTIDGDEYHLYPDMDIEDEWFWDEINFDILGAFSGCSGFNGTLNIGNSVTEIGWGAFKGCSGLTSVIIGNSVTEIGWFAFYDCSGLTSVTIPNSVTSIGDYAFDGCSGLTDLYSYIENPSSVSLGDDVFWGVPTSTCVLHVPAKTTDLYRVADQWKDFTHIMEESSNNQPGDMNGDGVVDVSDLNLIINEILAGTSNNDLNGDGTVDVADLNIIINIILGIDPDPGSGLCPDGHHPHWIDLGLPSGTLWACCNVGATDPTGYGDYFAWGETEPKEEYLWGTYKWCMGSYDTLTKYCTHPDDGFEGFCDSKMWLDLEDDAAYVNWDKRGRMPSLVQIQELLDSCDSERVERNGVWGLEFTSRLNGASLFFPAAAVRDDDPSIYGLAVGEYGDYWSRTLYDADAPDCAYSLSFYYGNAYWNWDWERYGGHSVRAVRVGQPAPPPAGGTTYTVNGVSFNMISVAGGTFTMGATAEQGSDASAGEKPAHEVTLNDFAIGQTEVTQALWQAVMGSNPSWFKGESLPVENVSWEDCQTFITKLNELTGKTFRLPTEAEWEYAARGGSKSVGFKYAGGDDIDEVAWYDSNSDHTTQPVATKAPNELGLYDMSGNVWELCSDWYNDYSSAAVTNPTGPTSGSYRMIRGGSWFDDAWSCRVSNRGHCVPTYRGRDIGFRLAM